jgi:hypothetical protein
VLFITILVSLLAAINIYLVVRLRIMESKVDYIDDFLYERFSTETHQVGSLNLEDFMNLLRKVRGEEEEDGEE